MRASVKALSIAATSAIVLFAGHRLVVGHRGAIEDASTVTATSPAPDDAASISVAVGAGSADPPRGETDVAASRRRELLSMSETFRNTSLVIAIRDAGLRCERIVDVAQGGDGVAAWRVSCNDARVYWTGVGNDGGIVVDSISYSENFAPFPGEVIQPEDAPPVEPARPLR